MCPLLLVRLKTQTNPCDDFRHAPLFQVEQLYTCIKMYVASKVFGLVHVFETMLCKRVLHASQNVFDLRKWKLVQCAAVHLGIYFR